MTSIPRRSPIGRIEQLAATPTGGAKTTRTLKTSETAPVSDAKRGATTGGTSTAQVQTLARARSGPAVAFETMAVAAGDGGAAPPATGGKGKRAKGPRKPVEQLETGQEHRRSRPKEITEKPAGKLTAEEKRQQKSYRAYMAWLSARQDPQPNAVLTMEMRYPPEGFWSWYHQKYPKGKLETTPEQPRDPSMVSPLEYWKFAPN